MTEEGLRWVDPERIIMGQRDKIGSEEHRQLLIKTIEKLHESNMLVVSAREKHSFDLVAWPMNQKKRYLWDLRGAKGYEAQTSARKDSVEMNIGKGEIWNVPLVWVGDEETVKAIMELTKGTNEYMVV